MNISFISRRFNSGALIPKSARFMRIVTIGGISMAVCVLVIAVSVGSGFEKVYRNALMNFNSHLMIIKVNDVTNSNEVISKIKNMHEFQIEGVTPFIYREALAMGKGGIRGVVMKGVDPVTLFDVSGINVKTDSGKSLDEVFKGSKYDVNVIVGSVLAKGMSGTSTIKLMIPNSIRQKFILAKVVGSFDSGIYDYDSQFVLAPLDDIRRLYGMKKNSVSGFEIKLKDPTMANDVGEEIIARLGPLYQFVTWKQLNGDILSAVKLEKFVSAIVMGLLVMISMLNIAAVIVLGIMYRLHEVSILRAIGMLRKDLSAILVRSGMFVDIFGTGLGIIFGVGISLIIRRYKLVPLDAEIYLIDFLPVDVSASLCGIIAVLCIGIGFLISKSISARLSAISMLKGLNL